MTKVKSEEAPEYNNTKLSKKETEDAIIANALAILDSRRNYLDPISSPEEMRNYLRLKISQKEYEVFCCIFLDQRHKVIDIEEMFRGTIDGASVYPREVVKAALKNNAAAVIFAHNHPSGEAEPSSADKQITTRLKDALALVDIRVLDHFIIGNDVVSFAERGLI